LKKKIALVHDALINKGGAERVFQSLCEMFPKAPVYTAVYLPDKTLPYFKSRKIITTPLQKIIFWEKQFKILFPMASYFMQNFNFNNFDIVLSSSTYCGKYILKGKSHHVCYMHQPFRLLWSPNSYKYNMAFNVAMMLLRPFNNVLMKWVY